jgi:peptide/nickel transport system substrate-binding protein
VAPNRSTALLMTDMTVTDPLTLHISLSTVNGQFPRLIANQMPWIGSPTAIQKQGPDDFAAHPVGAGPFLLKEWLRGDHVTLQRNPAYWNAPMPYLDQITIRLIPDDTQRYNSVRAGEITMGRVALPQQCASAKTQGKNCILAIPNGGNDLLLNNSKPPFDNKTFRQALAEAIDLDAYNTTIEGGAGIPARTLFQQASPFFENIPVTTYNPADASAKFKAIFDANGGKKSEFTINAAAGKSTDAATFFQAQLLQNDSLHHFRDYVTVNVQTVTGAVNQQNAITGNYQAQIWAHLPIDPEPNLYSSFRSGVSTNFSRYSNSKVDADLDQARTSLDPNVRHAAYKDFQQIWADEQPAILYARVQVGFISDPKVQDLRLLEDGTPLWDRIWLSR